MRYALILGLILQAAPTFAQPVAEPALLRGESAQTRKRLTEAEQKVIGGKAAEAVEDLQRILDEAGDDLISVDGKHHRSARSVAHQILAKLPADVLKSYQNRIDEPARKLLEAAKRDRDPKPLWRLLDRYFVSRPAEEGLLLLGDLLFERGDFRLAEHIWKRLLPDVESDVNYPNPKTDPAAVRARIILAIHFQGESTRAAAELEALEKKYPDAKGAFAGKTAPYSVTLRDLLAQPVANVAVADRTWPEFGGGPARTGCLRGPIPIRWPTRPTWVQRLYAERVATRIKPPPARPPFGHPVVMDGWVYVSDGSRVIGFELATGTEKKIYPPADGGAGWLPNEPPSCPSLAAAQGRLYARVGSSGVRPPDPQRPYDSAIVCLAPEAAVASRFLWRLVPPSVDGKANAIWEGSPIVANGRLWAAYSRFEGGRILYSVACYDPADGDTAPERPAWTVDVCETPLLSSPELQVRGRMELLTLAGRNIVFNTNAGAVVALDAGTGSRAWAFLYPRTARRLVEANRTTDPAPAIASGGRVFVAPADAERAFGLDAETGQELWESGPLEGAQLLGVVRNRLILTSTGPIKGLRALNVMTGSQRRPDGWVQSTGLGYGLGIVSESAILWPSREGLYILDPDTGSILSEPMRTLNADDRGAFFGNVIYADGWLVVVTAREVWGYRPDGPPHIRPNDPRGIFASVVDQAERDLANGNESAARAALLDAARGDFPKSLRAWAAARALSLTKEPLDFPDLRDEWLFTANGELLSLGTLLDRRSGKPEPTRCSPGAPWSAADRKLLDVPTLGAEARVASTLRLPPNSFPLLPIRGAAPPRNLFFASPGEVLAVSLAAESKAAFTREGSFTFAADLPEGFVLAGPLAVAVYGSRREPVWVFRVPETDPLPGSRRVFADAKPPELSSFVLAGEWLFARLGDRHLIALDLKTHGVAWVLGAPGSQRYEPHLFHTMPGFTPQFLATERMLAVQLTDGRRWFVQSSTGRVKSDESGIPTASVAWPLPPAALDGNRFAFPDGPGLVRFTSGTTAKPKFRYQAEGESSLAGEPPQIRRFGETLFVAVRRNYGVELERLEPSDGKPEWRTSAFLDAGSIDLAAADADPQRLFVPTADALFAFNRDDGKLEWQTKLPANSRWTVRAGSKVAIAYPAEAIPDEEFLTAWKRIRDSFLRDPQPWRLPWLAAALYDCWTERSLPVLLFDLETGKLLKTIRLPARGPCVRTAFEGDLAVVSTSERVCWLK